MADNERTDDPLATNARKLLADADAELAEQRRARPKMPDRPFVTGVMSFLYDPAAAFNLLIFSAWINLLFKLGNSAVALADEGGRSQILALLLIVLLAVTGLPFVLWFSAICLAVVRDSASGLEKIVSWPGLDITECLAVLLYTVLSLCFAAIPGYLVGQLLVQSSAPPWSAVASGVASLTALYPIAMLSTLKAGSPIAVVSPAIVRSISATPGVWCRFYLLAVVLVLVGVTAAYLMWIAWFVFGFLLSVPLVAAAMVYHRLLGRLAWVLATRADRN